MQSFRNAIHDVLTTPVPPLLASVLLFAASAFWGYAAIARIAAGFS